MDWIGSSSLADRCHLVPPPQTTTLTGFPRHRHTHCTAKRTRLGEALYGPSALDDWPCCDRAQDSGLSRGLSLRRSCSLALKHDCCRGQNRPSPTCRPSSSRARCHESVRLRCGQQPPANQHYFYRLREAVSNRDRCQLLQRSLHAHGVPSRQCQDSHANVPLQWISGLCQTHISHGAFGRVLSR